MSTIDDMLSAVTATVQGVHGRAVILKGPTVDPLTVTAVALMQTRGDEQEDGGRRDAVRSILLSLDPADIDDITEWKTVEVDEVDWTIKRTPLSQSESLIVVRLVQPTPIERSLPGYRSAVPTSGRR